MESYESVIFERLLERDRTEFVCFLEIVDEYRKLLELKNSLEIQLKKFGSIKSGSFPLFVSDYTPSCGDSKDSQEKFLIVNAQLQNLNSKIEEHKTELIRTQTKYELAVEDLEQLKTDYEQIQDSHETLKMQKTELEEQLKDLQVNSIDMEQRIVVLKKENEDLINEILKLKDERNAEILSKSAGDLRTVSFSDVRPPQESNEPKSRAGQLPTRILGTMTAKDDINCLNINNNKVAAGSGSEVLLYHIDQGIKFCGSLKGFFGNVNSIDFNKDGSLILTASSDKACRIWYTEKFVLLDSLMGHTDRVQVAKFSAFGNTHVFSGSRDRLIKFWDTKTLLCKNSLYIPSSCVSLVSTSEYTGISGHLDKKCRVFDSRSNTVVSELEVSGKITSLSSADNMLLVSCRDNTLQLLDLRVADKKVLKDDSFNVSNDWSQADISHDCQYAACGSTNGSVVLWDLNSLSVKESLRGHKNPVVCCTWGNHGEYLASSDNRKKIIVWH